MFAKLVTLGLQIQTCPECGSLLGLWLLWRGRRRLTLWAHLVPLTLVVAISLLLISDVLIIPQEADWKPRAAPLHVDDIVLMDGLEEFGVTLKCPPQGNAVAA